MLRARSIHHLGLAVSARAANSQITSNEKLNFLAKWSDAPTRIEPVRGTVILKVVGRIQTVGLILLDGAGCELPHNHKFIANLSAGEWRISLAASRLHHLVNLAR